MTNHYFPTLRLLRMWAMLKKEFIQIKRDYITYLSLMLIPFVQLIFFGYVLNTDAHHLPAVVLNYDSSQLTNSIIQSFKNTQYFSIKDVVQDKKVADSLMHAGKVNFVINIPQGFTRDLIRNKKPHILIEGDGTDPVAVSNAFHAATIVANTALSRDLKGQLAYLASKDQSFVVDTHANYNSALLTTYHSLPSLIATLLTITLVMITAISIATEYEHGTIETLLITPIKPIEVIIGKIVPHLLLGYILFFLALAMSYWVFHVPFYGSLLLLSVLALPFFITNLGVGLAVSSVSKTQFRAANLANTYLLPAILLSGFMFPFYAMPTWAQWIGEMLPTTHYLRITINIMLKGSSFTEVWHDVWPILLFMVIIIYISLRFYRKTLD